MCICFLLLSCTGGQTSRDMVSYINQDLMNIAQLESLAFKHYAAVTGNNYTTDQAVYLALKNQVIPYYKRFYELLKEISPQDPRLSRTHVRYVYGASDILNGFKAKMIGLEGHDDALVRLANLQIEAGAQEVDKWRIELAKLISENKSVRFRKE